MASHKEEGGRIQQNPPGVRCGEACVRGRLNAAEVTAWASDSVTRAKTTHTCAEMRPGTVGEQKENDERFELT